MWSFLEVLITLARFTNVPKGELRILDEIIQDGFPKLIMESRVILVYPFPSQLDTYSYANKVSIYFKDSFNILPLVFEPHYCERLDVGKHHVMISKHKTLKRNCGVEWSCGWAMCVCMCDVCVCICVYVQVCICLCVYVCVRLYIHMSVYIYVCVSVNLFLSSLIDTAKSDSLTIEHISDTERKQCIMLICYRLETMLTLQK